jgi:hypothetical protein
MPPPPYQEAVWTTEDELAYLRGLRRDGKVVVLRAYVRVAHHRRWFGPGMRVNAGMVILAARDMLAEMEREA